MRHTLEFAPDAFSTALAFFPPVSEKEHFRQRFRCALIQCIGKGFHVEECFGMIWEETLEEVELSCREQNELYPELIEWARRWM